MIADMPKFADMFTGPEDEPRRGPPTQADERATISGLLDWQRGTLELKCSGLDAVLLHMVEEYARHNGHADLLRQRIDGAVGQ